jgi:mannose-6-phosphate isomerase-like protein (cupin superfamily)
MGENKKSNEPEWMGKLPFPPGKKKPVRLSRDKIVKIAYGKGNRPVTVTIYADTDRLYFSEYSVKPGSWFEPPDIHAGDECYYCLEGTATMFDPVHGEVIDMSPGDAMVIPKGAWHQGYNFGEKNFRLITIIAPKAWADVDVNFKGKPAYYKGEDK